jgi:hypothetical protein
MTGFKTEYKLVAILAIFSVETTWAFLFVGPHLSSVSTTPCHYTKLQSKLFGPEDDGDFDNDDIGGMDPYGSESGGENLAKNFYEELRKREEGLASESASKEESSSSSSTFPTVIGSSSSIATENVESSSSSESTSTAPLPKKKFTGMQESFYAAPRPSAPSSRGGQSRTPREQMMEREYQLVGRAERNIGVQAVIVVLALAFYIYVGLSGGIVSGADAQMEDFGGDDEIMPFEQVMPVQRDREVSVWL